MIRALILFLCLCVTVIAQEPREIAQEALIALRICDAKRLDAVSHPELKQRYRTARVVNFYILGKPEKIKALESASDAESIVLFCDALRSISPPDDRFEYYDRFVETRLKGDLAILVFDSGWRLKGDLKEHGSKQEVLLKKSGADWRFLWSPAISVHVDLTWRPFDE